MPILCGDVEIPSSLRVTSKLSSGMSCGSMNGGVG